MNVWIITTGSSDVQLTTDKHWNELCNKAQNQQDSSKKLDTQKKIELTKSVVKPQGSDIPIKMFLAPARAMGIVYGNAITEKAEYYDELDFPLLNSFSTVLNKQNIVFNKIIVFVTDQANLFQRSEKNQPYCPYWQDTCTLETILKQYFQNFPHKVEGIEPEFLILQPDTEKSDADSSSIPGLDDWNNVLKLVQKEFANFNDIPEGATIYVSHQASTPAISSAVQFVSLARFSKQVKFLVSNEYKNKPLDPIESSEYLRGIQIQQAKGLIKSGTPGAALQLLKLEGIKTDIDDQALTELEKLVDFFNLNRSLADGASEFDIEPATQRVIDALELIEKLFEQENYLQGIALLASAQETFLKCAIKNEIKARSISLSINGTTQVFQADDLIKWVREGLKFIDNSQLESNWSVSGSSNKEINRKINDLKRETLDKLLFPIEDERFQGKNSKDPNAIEKNEFLLKWLCKLRSDFQAWKLLQWSCIDKNEEEKYEDDIRNKLMHNLQGVKKEEVVKYLLGNKDTPNTEVIEAYKAHVKPQFIEGIRLCGLPFTEQKLADTLQNVADGINVKSS